MTSFMRSLQTFPLFYSLVLPLLRVHLSARTCVCLCVCVFLCTWCICTYRGSHMYSPEDNLGYCSVVPQALSTPFEIWALNWPGT